MYNQNYDDYMRSILGYSNPEDFRNNPYNMSSQNMYSDLEQMYPEVYRVVYPMVCSVCDRIPFSVNPITEEMITQMTDDIYDRVESDGRITIDVNVSTEIQTSDNRETSNETRQRRRPRNRFLRDLIRILLLRELFNRRRRFPFNTPFPMRPF